MCLVCMIIIIPTNLVVCVLYDPVPSPLTSSLQLFINCCFIVMVGRGHVCAFQTKINSLQAYPTILDTSVSMACTRPSNNVKLRVYIPVVIDLPNTCV